MNTSKWLSATALLLQSILLSAGANPPCLDSLSLADDMLLCNGEDSIELRAVETPNASDEATSHALAGQADAVFVGEVVGIDYRLSTPDSNGYATPFTFVTWVVEDGVKGVETGEHFTARFIGGPEDDGVWMEVTEVPRFAEGDRDMLFVRGNGEVGCPLVGGARGRIRLDGSQDGLSPSVDSEVWVGQIASGLRELRLDVGASAHSLELGAPFAFAWPSKATKQQRLLMAERAKGRLAPGADDVDESPEERAERLALELNGNNPVLPR